MKICIRMLMPAMLICIFLITPVFGQDSDADGVLDDVDNCIEVPNGPYLGTCVETVNGMVSRTRTGL